MWLNKTIAANKDLQIRKGDTMTGTFTFTKNGVPWPLTAITCLFKIYRPGSETPIEILSNGNGFTQAGNTITFNKIINLETTMYRYELFFNYTNASITDTVVMQGGFFVRKNAVTENSISNLVITDQNINVAIAITIPVIAVNPNYQLTVTANGQTQFNVFIMPAGDHHLEINGVLYYKDADYTVAPSGQNVYLTWLNSFQLQTSDKLIFKTS